jgi:molybdopterin-containing oxidoreductase family membrane subunit
MGFNLFLTAAEVFKEFYSNTEDLVFFRYLYFGFHGHTTLVPFAWASVVCGVAAFLLFLIPRTRKNWVTLNLGCLLIYSSVYIEKGMGLIIPGLTPDTLGEIYEYRPSTTEVFVASGIFAIGFLVFTLMLKVAVPIILGQHTITTRPKWGRPEASGIA